MYTAVRLQDCCAPIERSAGCNHMKCSCGCNFCWLCGGDYAGGSHFQSGICPQFGGEAIRGASGSRILPTALCAPAALLVLAELSAGAEFGVDAGLAFLAGIDHARLLKLAEWAVAVRPIAALFSRPGLGCSGFWVLGF